MASNAVVVLHPMHTARASYAVQHDYKGQYAALPNLVTADHAAPPAAAAAAAALDGMSPAAALVDSWRNKHAVVTGAADDSPAELDSYHRTGRKSSSSSLPHRTPSTASRSRRPPPPPPGAASSFEQSAYYPDSNQHRFLSPPPPPPQSSSHHHHHHPPPPRHPAAQQQQQQQQRGQAHPSHAYQQATRYSAPAPSRSQPASATAAAGSSSRTSRQHHRDRDRDRARHHHVPYDADYDRQLASPGQPNLGAAASSSSPTAAAAASRGLFDPRGGMLPSSSSSTSKRHTPGGGSSSSPRRSQTGEGRSSRTRHGSSATSTLHPPPLPEGDNPVPRPSSRAGDDRRPPTRSKREPVQLADLGRRAGTTTTMSGGGASTTTHHRGGIPTTYDAKDSRESLESLGTDFSGRTKSSGAANTGGRRRRRADAADGADEEGALDTLNVGGGAASGAGTAGTSAGGGGKNRQLFDPRKDDPMRFAVARPSAGVSSASQQQQQQQAPPAYPSTAGFTGSTVTLQTESVMNLASPSGTAAAADDASSIRTGASGHHDAHPSASSSSSKRPDHPILAELKKAYRGILELEKKLQDEHRKANKEAERAAEDAAAANGTEGVQIQGQGKRYDDEYWVKLAKAHKQLAEAHYSFLRMALDPHIPAGLHSLPQRYNIPTRLWQVAFHQLLERMRHAVISAPVSAAGTEGTNVLDHLIEFIQFAYTHYSQLFEDPAVAVFRAAWIEQLGDLARYRMAVAGLASRVHAAQAIGAGGKTSSSASSPLLDPLDDLELDAGDGVYSAAPHRNPPPQRRPADAASIGQAALNDWDLEEQETWREMAREWYALGLAENPGTGRLQHHLALLSKGDELRALYHYSKSLTTAHPYLSARESILPLFEEEHQARRTQSDVTQQELFVHLHGMLFTKISLDDFDECLERFLERLRQEAWALNKARGDTTTTTTHVEDAPVYGDREWCMLGIINIAALLQYGTEDGVLRKLMTPEPGDKAEASTGAPMPSSSSKRYASKHHGRHESNRVQPADRSRSTPQALMVKRSDGDGSVASPSITDNFEDDGSEMGLDADDVVKQLQPAGTTEPEDDPLPFKLAQRLAFSILSTVLEMPFFRIGMSEVPNPYVTILCTFLGHVSHHPAAMRHLERSIPWDTLAALFNRVSPPVEIRLETPNKLVGGKPLPEDHCLRGMEWAGRQLFGRGYWREPRSRSNAASPASGFGDAVAPPIEGVEGTAIRVETEADALRFDLNALRGGAAPAESTAIDDGDGQSAFRIAVTALSEGKWRRLAICAAWLVRNVPGFDYDVSAVDPRQRFQVSGALRQKLERWRREDEEAREAERLSRLALEDRNLDAIVEDGTDGDESDEEDFEDENDSEEVRALKARRRQLKSIIRQARAATRAPRGQKGAASKAKFGSKAVAAIPHVFPGYTVLVFDTNILLTSIALLSELVAAECWTIVIPLAVVTELDGIKRNSTPLGVAASEAIDYLEQAVRGYSRHLKIQTSRGNYLKDLSIRNEAIDFDGADPASSHDSARSLDDVILRAASWQKEHFSNRLALVNPCAIAEQRKVPSNTAPVVLVTFDRNLRLKASARGVEAIDEKGLKKAIDATSSGNG